MQLYPLLPRLAAIEQRSSLAYTGSSAFQCRPPGAPAPLDRPLDALLQTKPAAVLAFDLFGKAGPKTSVAVDAARGDAHAPAFLRSLAIATARR